MSNDPIVVDAASTTVDVLTFGEIDLAEAVALLARYGLHLELIDNGAPIPGSYWGEREAGLIGTTVYARRDTPVHSLLHEACHLIVIPPDLRACVHTDASDSQLEEDATCYLQLLLADELSGFGMERAFADMDAWGYSFRLGSAKAWFERDAEDAAAFLESLPHLRGHLHGSYPHGQHDASSSPQLPEHAVMSNTLYIGYKNYSSWSLRPWLCLRWAGIAFEEQVIRLDQPGYGKQQIAEVKAVAPNGTVPALHTDGVVIWDSLAIAEWAAEQAGPGVLWPIDPRLRAQARSAACEMHSGFAAVRRDLSMNIHRRLPVAPQWPDDTRAGLARIDAMWTELRERHAHLGPFLFGQRCIADAFFTPVATRLRTYAVPLSDTAAAYRDTLLADADFRAWEAASVPNSWDASGYSVIDGLYA